MYQERVVCFIDILGFKNIIERTVTPNGDTSCDEVNNIASAFQEIEYYLEPDEYEQEESTLTVTHFSDCVVMSFDYTENSQIFSFLLKVLRASAALIHHGMVFRGAVVVGKVVHSENQVFGPAIVKAYELESRKAIYPRIIVDEIITDIAGKYRASHHDRNEEIEYVMRLLTKDSDGRYFVDYYNAIHSEFDDMNAGYYQHLLKLHEIISDGLSNSIDSVREKYVWMARHYNDTVAGIKEKVVEILPESMEPDEIEPFLLLPILDAAEL